MTMAESAVSIAANKTAEDKLVRIQQETIRQLRLDNAALCREVRRLRERLEGDTSEYEVTGGRFCRLKEGTYAV